MRCDAKRDLLAHRPTGRGIQHGVAKWTARDGVVRLNSAKDSAYVARVTRLVGRGCLRNGAAVRRSPEVFGAEGLIAPVAHEWQKVELQNPRTR